MEFGKEMNTNRAVMENLSNSAVIVKVCGGILGLEACWCLKSFIALEPAIKQVGEAGRALLWKQVDEHTSGNTSLCDILDIMFSF